MSWRTHGARYTIYSVGLVDLHGTNTLKHLKRKTKSKDDLVKKIPNAIFALRLTIPKYVKFIILKLTLKFIFKLNQSRVNEGLNQFDITISW